jgi:catechol 2,3-dioxygenase-like lactoylglutathione lyase family enzyme
VFVSGIDHLVLTVADVDASIAWYERVLGMRGVEFGGGRRALTFGTQKINLHREGEEIAPHADRPTPGSADLCFLGTQPAAELLAHLERCGVEVERGPVPRSGATGPIESVYFRDPDGNLIEVGLPA